MNKNCYQAFFVCFLIVIFNGCTKETVTIRETMKSFYTYSYSDPDPIPRPERDYYPYFRYDGYSKASKPVEWKVIEMENSYVKVHIFPEIGGKIWGAIEKSTGNEFIYYNSVVKFRDIGMRGPWTSGGIEFNFGKIGHSPHVSTPVDYMIRKNKDGSVSCFIGGIDLLTRCCWETEINLQRDKAYFTTRTRYSNFTSLLQPYYQWSNGAYQAEGGLRLYFPGKWRIGHGGEVNSWPVSEDGRDLSVYDNNDFDGDKSYHIIGSTEGSFAAYWQDLGFGSGHYSLYGDKLGEKIWLWSHARSGRIWEDLLTDNDGQYVELQSGRLFNQASSASTYTPFRHFGFFPHFTDEFQEYWYPIMDIGGVVKANEVGAINVEKNEKGQKIYFSPVQKIKGKIMIYFGDELQYTYKINKRPLEVWEALIPKNPANKSLQLKIINDSNEELLSYSEDDERSFSERPVKSPDDFDWDSLFGLYEQGIDWIYQGEYEKAYESLKSCLTKDSLYAPALNHLAELYFRKSDFKKALTCIKKSLSINTYDPKANFVYGLVNRQMGNLVDAQDGFAVASISPEYRVAAWLELAKLFIMKKELKTAQQYVEKVLAKEKDNEEALLLRCILSRKMNRMKEANKNIDRLEYFSPLNHFARFERLLLKPGRKSVENFTSLIRNELPFQTFLEMALWYEYLRCRTEAIKMLELAPTNALIDLLLSYLYNYDGEEGKSEFYLKKFIQDPSDFVFPFRSEMIPVLEWAIEKTNHWKPRYYLGLLHQSMGNKKDAREIFTDCGDLPDFPYFYMARMELWKGEENYDVQKDLQKALQLGNHDWRTFLGMIDFYLGKGLRDKALELSEKSLEIFPSNDIVKYTHAKCLLANGYYSETLNELENTVILPNEGAQYGRITYRQAAVMLSLQQIKENKFEDALASIEKARLWPENLGVGRPFEVDERIEDFLEAEIFSHLNKKEKAYSLYNNIIDYTQKKGGKNSSTDILYLIALQRLGKDKVANEFLKSWHRNSPNDPILRWIMAVMNNNANEATKIEKEIDTKTGGTPWDPRYGDSEFELVKGVTSFYFFNSSYKNRGGILK